VALRPKPAASQWGRAFQVSLEFALAILIGVAIGHYADRWLGTSPWLLMLFTAFGFAAGLRTLMRLTPPPSDDPPSR
jgi:ATP synthase protein I